MAHTFELGLDTFGDVTFASDGTLKPQAQVLRDVVEEAVLADCGDRRPNEPYPPWVRGNALMKSIELIGTDVAPRVRDMMHG